MGLMSPVRSGNARHGTMIARLPNRGFVVEAPLIGGPTALPPLFAPARVRPGITRPDCGGH